MEEENPDPQEISGLLWLGETGASCHIFFGSEYFSGFLKA